MISRTQLMIWWTCNFTLAEAHLASSQDSIRHVEFSDGRSSMGKLVHPGSGVQAQHRMLT